MTAPEVTETAVPARAGRREWVGLSVIALACLLYSMDLTVLNLAVPALTRDLQPTASQLLWIVDIYGFMVAGLLITMGALGDRIGRRKLLLIGAAAFGVASVIAAFSTSAAMLIVTRALLGIAGATLAPSTLALIRNMFHDPEQRAVAIAIWVSCMSAGAAVGPVLGGALLQYFWWGSVFLMGVPVMLLLLAAGPFLLPEYRNPHLGPLDVWSALLSLASVLITILALKGAAEQGWSWPLLAYLAVGAALGAWFIQRQSRSASPMIDLRLFRSPAFGAALAAYTLATFVAFGLLILVSQYMQIVLGMGPLAAGLWTIPFVVALISGSMLSPWVARRFGASRTMAAGMLLAATGFALLAQVGTDVSPLMLVIAFIVYALGLSPVFTLATDLIVGAASAERAGSASALAETGAELGGALGIAVMGSVGMAIYRLDMAPLSLPTLPPQVAAQARATLGGAASAAEQLGGAAGPALLAGAKSAFVHGLHWAAWLAATLMVVMSVWVLIARPDTSADPAGRAAH